MNIDRNAPSALAPGRHSPVAPPVQAQDNLEEDELSLGSLGPDPAAAPAHQPEVVVLDEADGERRPPPGKESLMQSQYVDVWEQVTTDMIHNQIHLAGRGSRRSAPQDTMTARWDKFCFETFHFAVIRGQRVPGCMRGFTMWTCTNPGIKKFKPLMLNVIKYYAKQYKLKINNNEQPSILEMHCDELYHDIIRHQRAAKEMSAKKKEKEDTERAEKQSDERELGLRASLEAVSQKERERAAVAELGPQPTTSRANSTSRAAQEARKLQAAEERRLAEAAAKGSETINYAAGEKAKAPKHMDPQERNDTIHSVLRQDEQTADKLMTDLLAAFPRPQVETPNKKRRRGYSEINSLIKENLEERKMRREQQLPTDDLDAQRKELEEERSKIHHSQPANNNLQHVFNAAA